MTCEMETHYFDGEGPEGSEQTNLELDNHPENTPTEVPFIEGPNYQEPVPDPQPEPLSELKIGGYTIHFYNRNYLEIPKSNRLQLIFERIDFKMDKNSEFNNQFAEAPLIKQIIAFFAALGTEEFLNRAMVENISRRKFIRVSVILSALGIGFVNGRASVVHQQKKSLDNKTDPDTTLQREVDIRDAELNSEKYHLKNQKLEVALATYKLFTAMKYFRSREELTQTVSVNSQLWAYISKNIQKIAREAKESNKDMMDIAIEQLYLALACLDTGAEQNISTYLIRYRSPNQSHWDILKDDFLEKIIDVVERRKQKELYKGLDNKPN